MYIKLIIIIIIGVNTSNIATNSKLYTGDYTQYVEDSGSDEEDNEDENEAELGEELRAAKKRDRKRERRSRGVDSDPHAMYFRLVS